MYYEALASKVAAPSSLHLVAPTMETPAPHRCYQPPATNLVSKRDHVPKQPAPVFSYRPQDCCASSLSAIAGHAECLRLLLTSAFQQRPTYLSDPSVTVRGRRHRLPCRTITDRRSTGSGSLKSQENLPFLPQDELTLAAKYGSADCLEYLLGTHMETLRDRTPAKDVSSEGSGNLSTVQPATSHNDPTLLSLCRSLPRWTAPEEGRHACARFAGTSVCRRDGRSARVGCASRPPPLH